MRGRRVLVTGSTGFLGAHLCRALVDAGADVVALRRPASNLVRLEAGGLSASLRIVDADLAVPSEVTSALRAARPEVVFHLAAAGVRQGTADAAALHATNVAGAANLAAACVGANVRRIVWLGSGFEYAPREGPLDETAPLVPWSAYGASKLAGWSAACDALRGSSCGLVMVRLFSAFGPWEHPSRFIPHVITRALRGEPVELTDGTQQRDYLHARDVGRALLACALERRLEGAVFNLGSGEPRRLRDIVQIIARLTAAADLRFGARPRAPGEPQVFTADAARLRKLGWSPSIRLDEGLRETVTWYDRHRDLWSRL